METVIDRRTGYCSYSSTPDFKSSKVIGFGRIDRLHKETGAVWHPAWEMVESYLAGKAPEDIPQSATNIEGRFLIIYQDGKHVFIFADRYSVARFYYRLTPTSLEIFDQILGKIPNLQVNEPEALAFVLFRFLPGRRTLFDQVYQLIGWECLVLDLPAGRFHLECSSAYPQKNLPPLGYPEAGQKFHELFRAGIEARLQAYSPNEPLLLPLSGGFDSRYMLATALELVSPSRIKTFTFGTPGSYDFEFGQRIARTVGVKNITFPLSYKTFSRKAMTQRCADTDAQIDVSREMPVDFWYRMAEHGRVIFSGNPGNSMTGDWIPAPEPFREQRAILSADLRVKRGDPLVDCLDKQLVDESFDILSTPERPSFFSPELWILHNRLPKYLNLCAYVVRDHFDYISPFYNYEWVDFVLNLPIEMRFGRKLYLYWLAKHNPILARIPCAYFNGVPLTASRFEKFLAKQWDRFTRKVLYINMRVNRIDWDYYASTLLDFQKLKKFAQEIFSPGIPELIFQSRSRTTLLYSLKSLEVLCSDWNVNFVKELPEALPIEMPEALPIHVRSR